jgi:hypothetical protein
MTLLLLIATPTAVIAAPAPPKPAGFQKMIDCRAIAEPGARLACFDREVAAVANAEARQDLVVIDRAKVRTARKTLFGLSVPDLGIFGGGDDEEGVNRIEGELAAVGRNADGRWTFRLADGARWIQADSRELGVDPAPGQKIAIRKAAMGSFLANVNKQIAIRVRRVN